MDGPAEMTLPGLMETISRIKESWPIILIANATINADNATMKPGDPHRGGLVLHLHHWAFGFALTNGLSVRR